jgi:CHC2 zinc finger
MSTGNYDLRSKIDEAKRRLPLPALMAKLGLGEHAKKSALCPLHSDEHPSFSVFQGNDGLWHWRCFAGCGDGDEMMFLSKLKGLSLTEAISLYVEMAGFPPRPARKSHEYPACPASLNVSVSGSPESLGICVSVSEGQSLSVGQEEFLRTVGARNACLAASTATKKRFKLV